MPGFIGNKWWFDGAAEELKLVPIVAVPVGTTGNIKVWDGLAWVVKTVQVWNGSAWVAKPLKRWTGSAWVEVSY